MESQNLNLINFDQLSELQRQLGSDSTVILIDRFKLELEGLISQISNFEKLRFDEISNRTRMRIKRL